MKLWYAPASPFVRKALVTSILAQKPVERVEVNTNVVESDEALRQVNPLGKIPALELADGRVLYDSRVICAYLVGDLLSSSLNPISSEDRFAALTLEALGDGIMDAAVNTRYEQALRPEQYRWDDWIEGQMSKVHKGLQALENQWLSRLRGDVTVGVISVGCALGYLDFRFPHIDWRADHAELATWYADFASSEAMAHTAPAT